MIFRNGYILRDGFPFASNTNPANIYDAIVIKPSGETCWSPRYPGFSHSIDEYIEFVNKHSLSKAIIIANNIEFLKECPTLKYLRIIPSDSSDNNFDFSPIYQRNGIVSLDCSTSYGVNFQKNTSIDYSNIKGVVMLNIYDSGHLNTNSINTLKTLSVGRNREKNLFNLFGSNCLETLQIVDSSIVELNGIEQSNKLQLLELEYNRRLCDISALQQVKSTLTCLIIKNCPKIKDFSVLEKLEALESLVIRGKNELPDLSFLNYMKNLKMFAFDVNILNGDLTPCFNIQHVFCARNRKHYNFNNTSLPKSDTPYNRGYEGVEIWRQF